MAGIVKPATFYAAYTTVIALGIVLPAPPRVSATATIEGIVRCGSDGPAVVSAEPAGLAPPTPPTVSPVMDQRGLEFMPHVLPVVVGTRVAFRNSDPVPHNVFSPSPVRPFNLGAYPSGTTRYVTFDRPGVVEILCNVHLEMSAYIVVLRTPHFVLANHDGRYRIDGLSPALHTVSAWCPAKGESRRDVQVTAGTNRIDFDVDHGTGGLTPPIPHGDSMVQ